MLQFQIAAMRDAVVYFVCDDADTGDRQSVGDIYVGGLVESQFESVFPSILDSCERGGTSDDMLHHDLSQLVSEEAWGGGSLTTPYISFESVEEQAVLEVY